MREKLTFRNVSIGQTFYTKDKTYKKIDYEHGQEDRTREIEEFYLMDEVEIDKESKFKLNF